MTKNGPARDADNAATLFRKADKHRPNKLAPLARIDLGADGYVDLVDEREVRPDGEIVVVTVGRQYGERARFLITKAGATPLELFVLCPATSVFRPDSSKITGFAPPATRGFPASHEILRGRRFSATSRAPLWGARFSTKFSPRTTRTTSSGHATPMQPHSHTVFHALGQLRHGRRGGSHHVAARVRVRSQRDATASGIVLLPRKQCQRHDQRVDRKWTRRDFLSDNLVRHVSPGNVVWFKTGTYLSKGISHLHWEDLEPGTGAVRLVGTWSEY